MSEELAQSGLTMQLTLCWSINTTSCDCLVKLFCPLKVSKDSVGSVGMSTSPQLVKQVQKQIVQCDVKHTVKSEAGSCRIITSGWCLHEHISTSSQVDKAHGFECLEYAIGAALCTLQWSGMQQHSYNAHLVFKVAVPHGHICTELNLLQNVQWYETCSCRGLFSHMPVQKRHQIEETNRISE